LGGCTLVKEEQVDVGVVGWLPRRGMPSGPLVRNPGGLERDVGVPAFTMAKILPKVWMKPCPFSIVASELGCERFIIAYPVPAGALRSEHSYDGNPKLWGPVEACGPLKRAH